MNSYIHMHQAPALHEFIDGWPFDPENNVRVVFGANGREMIMVRQPMGLESYEADGRPDGRHPHGMESALEFQLSRLAAARRAAAEPAFKLTAADCAELFDEGTLYYHRFVHFFRLGDWTRAERDTARNLHLIDFLKHYAEVEEDRVQLETWRPAISLMNTVARSAMLMEKGPGDEALQTALDGLRGVNGHDAHADGPRGLIASLLQTLGNSPAICPLLHPHEESLFRREGDYWTIRYQGQAAILKATRGLDCLRYLLRHPRREIHVSELPAALIDSPVPAFPDGLRETVGEVVTVGLRDAGPILDSQAKAVYKRRIDELRNDLEEAERFNDSHRAARDRTEMDAIVHQLAAAVGLGGRDRRASSDAERARSAITKRIKESINRIAEAIPQLGRHLAARIKTGYFCSYNPHPDRPVAWKF
jgi:hypothetical protein